MKFKMYPFPRSTLEVPMICCEFLTVRAQADFQHCPQGQRKAHMGPRLRSQLPGLPLSYPSICMIAGLAFEFCIWWRSIGVQFLWRRTDELGISVLFIEQAVLVGLSQPSWGRQSYCGSFYCDTFQALDACSCLWRCLCFFMKIFQLSYVAIQESVVILTYPVFQLGLFWHYIILFEEQ